MLDRTTVGRLRDAGGDGDGYVVSVYLGHRPDLDELRTIPTRLKSLIGEVRTAIDGADENGAALERDLDDVVAMASELGGDLGRGSALFACSARGLREHVSLPAPVRDRIIVDSGPHLGPLEAMLDHFHRYAAAVVDRRGASLYRFHMGELQSWEELAADEPIRKDNFGGFGGYDEHRVRGHAEEVARRMFRTVAERIADLARTDAFDLLVVGGNAANTAALVDELPPAVTARLAGTFTVDVHTATPHDIREHCRAVAAEYDQRLDAAAVAEVLDLAASGGRAAVGVGPVLDAVNRGAVDRLLVAAVASRPGVRCQSCAALDPEREECPVCGAETRPVADIVDAIAEAVRARGGRVRYILGESSLSAHEVGATLRYAP